MTGISVKKAAEIVNGRLYGEDNADTEIKSVVIDSRKAGQGSLFAAIKGERVDGHDYICKAFEQGAVCCLAQRVPEGASGSVIVVEDVENALKTLAAYYRSCFDIPVIGITGSVGKTTCKEMISSVLSQKFKVHKTEKNLNNELGVPLTIFGLEPEHEVAVIEMGISDFGEMTRLAKMVKPTMAVYTLIGHAHLERLINREGVLRAKTEMVGFMPKTGTLFLNGDDDLLSKYECGLETVLYGTQENSDVIAQNIVRDSEGISCDIVCSDRKIHASVPAYGSHMVYAMLQGAALGIKFGLSDEEIIKGIESFETVGRRANVTQTGFVTLIDDCYNANPDSVKSAIDSLKASIGRKVCILGNMLELGSDTEKLHEDIGRYAAENSVELLLTVGGLSEFTSRGAKSIKTLNFKSNAELIDKLPELLQRGDIVLVKASHSMKFEEISEAIKLMK